MDTTPPPPAPPGATRATLRLSLQRDATALTPASVGFEVRLRGDPQARRLASVYGESVARAMRPDAGGPAADGVPDEAEGVVAQFTVTARELGLPLTPKLTLDTLDRSRSLVDRIIASAERKLAAAPLIPQWRADAVIRFAREHAWIPSPRLTFPPHAARRLSDALGRALGEGEPLWLEFVEPVGYLPLVAWEQVLRAATRSPVLRVSPHRIPTLTSSQDFVVLLSCSVADARQLPSVDGVRAMLTAMCPVGRGIDYRVHVFADAVAYPVFERAANDDRLAGMRSPAWRRVVLHAPPPVSEAASADVSGADAAPDPAAPTSSARRAVDLAREHPWVTWMLRGVNGQAVDVVHWFAAGAYPDEGILVAADPAVQRDEARPFRFVPAPALLDFLTQVGAWGAVFGGPSSPRSLFGLRTTADRIARARPGIAAAHDPGADPDATGLAALYRLLWGERGPGAAPGAGVLAYASAAWYGLTEPRAAPPVVAVEPVDAVGTEPGPAVVVPAEPAAPASAPPPPAGAIFDAYQSVTSAARTIYDRDGPTPTWVAATQRVAEQAVSQFGSEGAGDPAAARGVADALAVLRRALDAEAAPAGARDVAAPVPNPEDRARA